MSATTYAVVILMFVYSNPTVKNSNENKNQPAVQKICLTIDDGPGSSMASILDTLKKNNCRAIFYVVGQLLESKNGRELAKRAVLEGHLLGNHSYSHPMFSQIGLERAKAEINKTDKLIEGIYAEVGKDRPARLFRFPGGDCGGQNKKRLAEYLESLCYVTQLWDVDTNDWRYYLKSAPWSKSRITAECLKAKTGDVVLVHDRPMTAECLIPIFTDRSKYLLVIP